MMNDEDFAEMYYQQRERKAEMAWFESAVNAAGIDRDKQLRTIAEQHAEIERLNNNVECLLLAIGICQSGPDPRDLLNESVAMVSKSLEGKS